MAKKLFNETDAFKKLQARWCKKLEDDGFEDIEKGERKNVITPQVIKARKSQYDGGNVYYDLCQSILREFKFKKDIHRVIFQLHADGNSERVIVKYLEDKLQISLSQKGVNLVIRRVKESYLKGE